jgi:predicted AlkP superfamily pyrophosphatase or phosphodiesterase
MVAETIPNHVSMVTGAYPDKTGIVGNNFPVPGKAESMEAGAPSCCRPTACSRSSRTSAPT